jgi:hypothetical protein
MTKQLLLIALGLFLFRPSFAAEANNERLNACLAKIAKLTVDRVESDFPGHKYQADAPKMVAARDGHYWFMVFVHETNSPDGVERGADLMTTVDNDCEIVEPPTPEM